MKANNEKDSEINRLIEKYYLANQDNRNGYDKLAKELKRLEEMLNESKWNISIAYILGIESCFIIYYEAFDPDARECVRLEERVRRLKSEKEWQILKLLEIK